VGPRLRCLDDRDLGLGGDRRLTGRPIRTDGARTDGARTDGARTDGARTDGARTDGARTDGARPSRGEVAGWAVRWIQATRVGARPPHRPPHRPATHRGAPPPSRTPNAPGHLDPTTDCWSDSPRPPRSALDRRLCPRVRTFHRPQRASGYIWRSSSVAVRSWRSSPPTGPVPAGRRCAAPPAPLRLTRRVRPRGGGVCPSGGTARDGRSGLVWTGAFGGPEAVAPPWRDATRAGGGAHLRSGYALR
jgi:hypothetical protein